MADSNKVGPTVDTSPVNPTPEKEPYPEGHDSETSSIHSDPESLQAGVQKAQILRKAWTGRTMTIAFAGSIVFDPYVTSDFQNHSMLSVTRVVGNIAGICAFPIIAKLCDVFGRAEMFILAISLLTLSTVLSASTNGIPQFAIANVFDSIGSTAFALTQQVFVADATSLVDRGLWSSIPETVTTLPALYLGTLIADGVLKHSTWRWGYGMWAIILPVSGIPLIATMILLRKRAVKAGLGQKKIVHLISGCEPTDPLWKKVYQLVWVELDLFGALLLVAGLSLVLIPLSLTGGNNSNRWKEAEFIAMVVVGVVLLVAFAVWDTKFARKPFIPYRMVTNRTVIAASLASALDFMSYTSFTLFFPSYLQVAGGYAPGHAARIDNALRVSFQVFSVLIGLGMKYTKRSQMWLLMGPPLTVLSQGLLIYLVNTGYGTNGNEATFVTAKVLNGLGRALLQTAGQVSVQAVVSPQQVSVATGVYQASISVGGAVGVSIAGAIWRTQLPARLNHYLPADSKDQAMPIFQSIRTAMKFAPGSPIREAVNQSMRDSQRTLAIASTAAAVPMLIIVLFIKNIKLDEMDQAEIEKNEAAERREIAREGKEDNSTPQKEMSQVVEEKKF
ncbi:hypothetical protein FQN57_000117 [Myotisia sp. PD_48]|nr:hypothetical protein FQN57_000117 [Myotisia sp. PD_48]